MSSVYNPEADIIAEIERLELEAKDVRQKIEQLETEPDRRVLARQLEEVERDVETLRARLP